MTKLADPVASRALKASAEFWFLMIVIGQGIFLYYLLVFYGGPTVVGNFAAWDRNAFLFHGYVSGDPVGNLVFAAHVLFAATITAGGLLQLVPRIRARALWFHRWNGRVFLSTAIVISLGGLYLVLIRKSDPTGGEGIALNGVLILAFAAVAWRYARVRNIEAHRRWALRTFILVSGVWFFRVGLMAWMLLTDGAGSTDSFDGPFDRIWEFGYYLFPLLVLEIYLRARERAGAWGKIVVATGLAGLTAVMGVGIYGAYLYLWGPLL